MDISAAGSISASTATFDTFPGRPINLGTETAGQLSLTDAELNRVAAAALQIGAGYCGNITVSADITRPAATNVTLLSSNGAINFASGLIDTAGGDLSLSPGSTASVSAAKSGNDVNVGANNTLSFTSGSNLAFAINGPNVDSDYQQLN